MAQACPDCGGVGFGRIDPDGEMGWRSESPKGQAPKPCPTCTAKFETYAKSSEAKIQFIDLQAGGKKIPRNNELAFGTFVDPQAVPVRRKTIQAIDSDGRNLSDEMFDPGVVETGNEKVSIEQALANTAAEVGEE